MYFTPFFLTSSQVSTVGEFTVFTEGTNIDVFNTRELSIQYIVIGLICQCCKLRKNSLQRQGKLNSLLIVTACMDFQIIQKFSDFIFNTINIWHFEPHPPIALIGGLELGDFGVRAQLSSTLYWFEI